MDITDVITWSSNKPAVATIDSVTGAVTLKGVGTVAITAKATSGKSAKVNVKVDATLTALDFDAPEGTVYSGQTITLVAKRNGSTTYPNKDATINAKGVLKITNKVKKEEIYVTLAHNKKGTNVEPVTKKIVIGQSSIDGFTITEVGGEPVAIVGLDSKGKIKQTKKETSNINVPLTKSYTATVANANDAARAMDGLSLLTWKTSNPKITEISGIDANATIIAKAAGNATITVSGIYYDGKKASVISAKFTVKVKQPVTTLTMSKPTETLAEKMTAKKDQKVSLTVNVSE